MSYERERSTQSQSERPWQSVSELCDDRQASVLYSPFREKSLNPASWNRKMKFWESMLPRTLREQRLVSFDITMLSDMFERNGMKPKCLATVVEQMKRSGLIHPLSHYQRGNGWLSWGFNALVKQPLVWGVSRLIGSDRNGSETYVCPDVVQLLCDEFLNFHKSSVRLSTTDNLVSIKHLRESCQHLISSDKDFDIIITQLERDKKVALQQAVSGDWIVKFTKPGDSAFSVTESDQNIYSIKTAMEKLETDIQLLSSRVNEHLAEAKLLVKDGNKKLALVKLRRKASLLKLIDKKSSSLVTLQDVIQKIEDAGTNEMVIKACEAASQAMKALNAKMSPERAEAVMDDLQEGMAYQEDISTILSSTQTSADEEMELERDLEELLREQPQPTQVAQLPSIRGASDSNIAETSGAPAFSGSVSDDIAAAFLAMDLEDLDLPEVPNHSPSNDGCEKKSAQSSKMLPS